MDIINYVLMFIPLIVILWIILAGREESKKLGGKN